MFSQVNRFAVVTLKKHIQIQGENNRKANSNDPEKRVLNQVGDHLIHPKNRLKIQSKNPLTEFAIQSTGLKEANSSKGQVINAKKNITPITPRKINSLIFLESIIFLLSPFGFSPVFAQGSVF